MLWHVPGIATVSLVLEITSFRFVSFKLSCRIFGTTPVADRVVGAIVGSSICHSVQFYVLIYIVIHLEIFMYTIALLLILGADISVMCVLFWCCKLF